MKAGWLRRHGAGDRHICPQRSTSAFQSTSMGLLNTHEMPFYPEFQCVRIQRGSSWRDLKVCRKRGEKQQQPTEVADKPPPGKMAGYTHLPQIGALLQSGPGS